eukprot:GHVQ01023510.1.p1 GENE.GHVQ01023510.1~~GHVQ01023510.1.p1  ORF type:complete len:338 (+),score=27.53 GHVQ01023510.1:103-1116(+)
MKARKESAECIWQDREIRFDQQKVALQLRQCEEQIDSVEGVEDAKGNSGTSGVLCITNLRILWCCFRFPRTNLSIGWSCVSSLSVKNIQSKLQGPTQALYVLTKYNGTRFEFVFHTLVRSCSRLFGSVQAVHRAYDTTRLYREVKLRGAIVKERELMLLPLEDIYDRVSGVWNLSSEKGNLGTLFVTNIRVVWFASLAENFNVSIPYMQMKSACCKPSKFGKALVIETSTASGGFVLGFRIEPLKQLEILEVQISNLHKVYSQAPIFGVKYTVDNQANTTTIESVTRIEDDVEIVDTGLVDPSVLYQLEGHAEQNRKPVYNADLGLAMEPLPGNVSL